jgi:hypothetical protein
MQNKPVPMRVTIKIDGKNMTEADIRHFIMMVREWELRTPKGEIVGLNIQTDPQLSAAEVSLIFKGVFKQMPGEVEVSSLDPGHLRLGRRAVCIDDVPIGICQEFEMSIGASSEDLNKRLQEAPIIELKRIPEASGDLADQMIKTLTEEGSEHGRSE